MSRGYNKVILMGNLARDPDIRVTTTQLKVARFTVAVGREWKDKNTGEKRSETDFISCQAWGATADVIDRYVRKGKAVMVEGRLQVRKYQDKSGADKWATDVVVDSLILLGSKGDGDAGAAAAHQMPAADYASINEVEVPF